MLWDTLSSTAVLTVTLGSVSWGVGDACHFLCAGGLVYTVQGKHWDAWMQAEQLDLHRPHIIGWRLCSNCIWYIITPSCGSKHWISTLNTSPRLQSDHNHCRSRLLTNIFMVTPRFYTNTRSTFMRSTPTRSILTRATLHEVNCQYIDQLSQNQLFIGSTQLLKSTEINSNLVIQKYFLKVLASLF